MAHHSTPSKQPEKVAGVNENHPLSDEVDIFDQLQHEFDALVSGSEPNTPPTDFSENTIEGLDGLFASDEQSDETISSDESPTENQEPDSGSMQKTIDEAPAFAEQTLLADAPNKTTRANATVDSVPHLKKSEKPSNTPISTILMIGLAVAILIAAVAGSLWTFNYPASTQTASGGQTDKDLRQVIINKTPRVGKYIPIKKSDSSASGHNAALATEQTAPEATSLQPSMQSGASHDKLKTVSSSPAQSGDWIINLESFNAENDAAAYAAKLNQHDIHANIMPVQIKGKPWYRVRLTGLPSKQEAEKQRLILVKKLNLASAWISKSRH